MLLCLLHLGMPNKLISVLLKYSCLSENCLKATQMETVRLTSLEIRIITVEVVDL